MENTIEKYALIGAGPAGLAGARNLQRFNIPFDGFEGHSDVGGLWDIDNPHSTVYETAHLISSKKMTEFTEFPMNEDVADYPHHAYLKNYFQTFAKKFGLYEHYQFNTKVTKVEQAGNQWQVTFQREQPEQETYSYKGIIIANGILSEPNWPDFAGDFSGELLHSASYKTPDIFAGKRVLVVGAGNSGCDIVVDAVHRASKVAISVRRGYHFVPKYVFGKPADAVGGKITLPRIIKQKVDSHLLKWFTGDAVRLGFPEPDHKLYESHPIINSLILYHLGHGDLSVKADIEKFAGQTVHFRDGSSEEYDMVLFATGYKLHYPFIDKKHLNWQGSVPKLYLNIFHPDYDNLFILGMVEATGLGWQGRYEQAELMARYIQACQQKSAKAKKIQSAKRGTFPDMRGGYNYLELDRMAYYVHKDTYRKTVTKLIARLT